MKRMGDHGTTGRTPCGVVVSEAELAVWQKGHEMKIHPIFELVST